MEIGLYDVPDQAQLESQTRLSLRLRFPRRCCAVSAGLSCPAIALQCVHTCFSRFLAGTLKVTWTPLPTGQTRRRGMRSQQPISPALSLRQRHVDRGKAFDGQTVSEHVLHLPLQLQSEGNAGVAQRQRRPFRQLPGHFPSPWQ